MNEGTKYSSQQCDRCNKRWLHGLYRHNKGHRCAACIWKEQDELVEMVGKLLNVLESLHDEQSEPVPIGEYGNCALCVLHAEATRLLAKVKS